MIHGMNHFWPGGSSDPELANFTDPKAPNGAKKTWSFVSRYTMDSTAMPCAEVKRCPERWLKLRVPAGAESVKAKVNGDGAKVRTTRRHARVKLPATRREQTVVVVRGRTDDGERFKRRHEYSGCG